MSSKIEEFAKEIEKLVSLSKEDYVDAILHYGEKNNIDVESLAHLVLQNQNLKGKISLECMKRNLIEKVATLPF